MAMLNNQRVFNKGQCPLSSFAEANPSIWRSSTVTRLRSGRRSAGETMTSFRRSQGTVRFLEEEGSKPSIFGSALSGRIWCAKIWCRKLLDLGDFCCSWQVWFGCRSCSLSEPAMCCAVCFRGPTAEGVWASDRCCIPGWSWTCEGPLLLNMHLHRHSRTMVPPWNMLSGSSKTSPCLVVWNINFIFPCLEVS